MPTNPTIESGGPSQSQQTLFQKGNNSRVAQYNPALEALFNRDKNLGKQIKIKIPGRGGGYKIITLKQPMALTKFKEYEKAVSGNKKLRPRPGAPDSWPEGWGEPQSGTIE